MDILDTGTYGGTGTAVVRALHSSHYTDPAIYELEKTKIFYRSWICLGHVCMAEEKGSYFVGKVADQEILIVRGDDMQLRAFYNVCRHRGHALATGSGKCRMLVCPYHAWTYDLRGGLRGAPMAEGVKEFDKSDIRLAGVKLEIFCGMIFVNLDPDSKPLSETYGHLEEEIRRYIPDIEQQTLVYDNPKLHRCSWKASVENFSECYHCGPVHKYLTSEVIDPETYKLEVKGTTQRHYICTLDKSSEQHLWFLWPNTAFGLYPIPGLGETFCIRHMYPISFDQAIYHYRWFVTKGRDPSVVVEYAKHHSLTTGDEDAAVAEGVQRGMNSRGFDQGFLLANPGHGASTEHAIVHFQEWVLRTLEQPDRTGTTAPIRLSAAAE